MKNSSMIICTLLLFIACKHSGSDLNRIPTLNSNNIQIDGIFTEGEWKASHQIELAPRLILFLGQTSDYVFLAIKNGENVSRYVDLYVDNEIIGTIIYMLQCNWEKEC